MAKTIQLRTLRGSLPNLVATASEVASALHMVGWTAAPEHIKHLEDRVTRLSAHAKKTEGQPQTTRIPDSIAGIYNHVLETIKLLRTNEGYHELVGHYVRSEEQRQEDFRYNDFRYMLRHWED